MIPVASHDLPDEFERRAVFTRAGVFVRWVPEGMEDRPEHAPGPLEHMALFRCTRRTLWTPVVEANPWAIVETTHGGFRVAWGSRTVVLESPEEWPRSAWQRVQIPAASLPEAWAALKIQMSMMVVRAELDVREREHAARALMPAPGRDHEPPLLEAPR